MRFLGEDLDGAVVVDRDGAGGDEELLGGALLLEHRHHAGPEKGEGGGRSEGDMVSKGTTLSRVFSRLHPQWFIMDS